MPCNTSCDKCDYLQQCGGDYLDDQQQRECGESCPHYDNINQCCWQSGEWGLCLDVSEGDYCHLNYKVYEVDLR